MIWDWLECGNIIDFTKYSDCSIFIFLSFLWLPFLPAYFVLPLKFVFLFFLVQYHKIFVCFKSIIMIFMPNQAILIHNYDMISLSAYLFSFSFDTYDMVWLVYFCWYSWYDIMWFFHCFFHIYDMAWFFVHDIYDMIWYALFIGLFFNILLILWYDQIWFLHWFPFQYIYEMI